jgi:hypothetical protein
MANFPSRALHDLGLAAWFGGTLANAVALNQAAGEAFDAESAGRLANAGWDFWTPVGTEPAATTPPEVADAQNKLRILHWVVPAITGALVIVSAFTGEQQRPVAMKAGILDKLNSLS